MVRWDAVDGLVRELGALRAACLALERDRANASVMSEADRIIGAAVEALEPTLDAPEDGHRLIAACEAIVTAQARIEALRGTAAEARHIVARSRELRVEARRLFQRIRSERP